MEEKNPNGFYCACAAAEKGGDGWRVEMLNGVEKFEGGERGVEVFGGVKFLLSQKLSEIF